MGDKLLGGLRLVLFLQLQYLFARLFTDLLDEELIRELDSSSYWGYVMQNRDVFVMFYDLRSGRCQKFSQVFIDLALDEDLYSLGMKFAQIKYQTNRQFIDSMGLGEDYPVLIYHKSGRVQKRFSYRDEIDLDQLREWLVKGATHELRFAQNEGEVILRKSEYDFIFVLEENRSQQERNEIFYWAHFNSSLPDRDFRYQFYRIPSEKSESALYVIDNRINQKIQFRGEWTVKGIQDFIEIVQLGLIMRPTDEVKKQIVQRELNTLFLIYNKSSEREIFGLAEQLKYSINNHLHLCLVDFDADYEKTTSDLIKIYALNRSRVPNMVIMEFSSERLLKYRIPQDHEMRFDQESIMDFVQKWYSKRLQPFHLSQEPQLVETLTNQDGVPHLNSVQFSSTLLRELSYDRLFYVFSPTCRFCSQFNPDFKKFYNLFSQSHNNLKIYKIDGTANELSEYLVEEYPTILLYKKNQLTPVKFETEGTKNFYNLEAFVLKQLQ